MLVHFTIIDKKKPEPTKKHLVKEYKLSYSVLGMLVLMCENTFTANLSKQAKNKEAEKHQLICEGLIIRLNDYSDYIPVIDAYEIYFQMSEADRRLAVAIL